MLVYCVSKVLTTGEADAPACTPVIAYLGTDYEEAVRIAKSIAPPATRSPNGAYHELYSALPTTVEQTTLRYHNNEDVWAQLASFELF